MVVQPAIVRFTLLVSRISCFCALSGFVLTLSIGLETLWSKSSPPMMRFQYFSSAFGLLLGAIILSNPISLDINVSIVAFTATCMLIFSLWTWPSATASGVYLVTTLGWVYVRFQLKISVYPSADDHVDVLPKKPSSFASSTDRNRTNTFPRKGLQARVNWTHLAPFLSLALVTIVVFSTKWHQYQPVNVSLALARASAAVVNLSFSLLAFPTLHRIWAFVYERLVPSSLRPAHTKSIAFHKTLALLAMVASFLHIQGHLAFLNMRRGQIYSILAWLTGIVLTTIIICMMAWSNIGSSRKRFEQVHVIGGVLGCTVLFAHGPSAVLWCIPGLIFTALERAMASSPKSTKVQLERIEKYGKGVLHLQFSGNIRLKGGEYVYLNIPTLGKADWRPFSAIPHVRQPKFSVFVRVRTDPLSWTKRLENSMGAFNENLERVLVDGPHLSPTCQYVNFPRIILAATGVGCTPIISVLRALRASPARTSHLSHITIAWIVPLRELADFEWMLQEILETCEWSLSCTTSAKIKVHMYVTGCVPGAESLRMAEQISPIWSSLETLRKALNNPVVPSVLQGASTLSRKTALVEVWRGRPVFTSLLLNEKHSAVEDKFAGKIGVFCCGPPAFVRDLRRAVKFATKNEEGTPQMETAGHDLDDDNEMSEDLKDTGKGVSFVLHREVF